MWTFKYPYSNFHELNLDWIIEKVKENSRKIETLHNNAGIGEPSFSITGLLNVKETGELNANCAGDGFTDDSANMSRCVEYAASRGMNIYIPAGNYIIDSLSVPRNMQIIGSGWQNTTLTAKSAGDKFITVGGNAEIIGIHADSAGVKNYGFFSENAGCAFKNCLSTRSILAGYYLPEAVDLEWQARRLPLIENCEAWFNYADGFLLDAYDVTINNCESVSNAQSGDGFNFKVLKAVKMTNCHGWNLHDWSGRNRGAISAQFNCSHSLVTNCHFEGGKTFSIDILGYANSFTSCFFYTSFGAHTMRIAGSNHIFTGCIWGDPSPDGASYQPEFVSSILNDNAYQVTVNACHFPVEFPIVDGIDLTNWFFNTTWNSCDKPAFSERIWQRALEQGQIGGANGSSLQIALQKDVMNYGYGRIFTVNESGNYMFKAINGASYYFINSSGGDITINVNNNPFTLNDGFNAFVFVNDVAYKL